MGFCHGKKSIFANTVEKTVKTMVKTGKNWQ